MSLSERLRKARTERLIQAGLLPRDHAAEPQDAEGADSHTSFAPITIEAQPASLQLVAKPVVDLTTRDDHEDSATCPTCHAVGFADMVDLIGHTVHYTCARCSTMWQVHKPAVDDSIAR